MNKGNARNCTLMILLHWTQMNYNNMRGNYHETLNYIISKLDIHDRYKYTFAYMSGIHGGIC